MFFNSLLYLALLSVLIISLPALLGRADPDAVAKGPRAGGPRAAPGNRPGEGAAGGPGQPRSRLATPSAADRR